MTTQKLSNVAKPELFVKAIKMYYCVFDSNTSNWNIHFVNPNTLKTIMVFEVDIKVSSVVLSKIETRALGMN